MSLTACGPYSFSSSGATHIQSITIPIFKDDTPEFGIEERLTDALIAEFTRDNTLKVTDRRNADSMLSGTITRVQDQAGSFTSDESVQDIQVFVTVQVQYQDLKKRKIVWEETLVQWGTFNPNEGTESRNEGIDEALTKLANEMLNKTVSGW